METFWLMVTAAVVMGTGIPITVIWSRHREKIAALEAGKDKADLIAENAELSERLQVLERIVTDEGYNVATQIEALRDQHKMEKDNGVPLSIDSKEKA